LFRVLKNRNFFIMLAVDGLLLCLSLFLAYYMRFDGKIPSTELFRFVAIVYWIVPLKLLFFLYFNLYKGMWRYTGIQDLKNLVKGCLVGSSLIVAILLLTVRFEGYPRSIFPLDLVFSFLLTGGARIGIRLFYGRKGGSDPEKKERAKHQKRVLIVGAGDAGEKALREMKDNPWLNYDLVGFVDDDSQKQGRGVHDVSILGVV